MFRRVSTVKGDVTMNWDQVKGNWKQFRGKVQEQWGRLTDDELDVIDGRRDILIGKVQERYGISKERAEQQIEDFETRHLAAQTDDDFAVKNRSKRSR
jgi:uncharacterized protein YjbJ (UPF0337 family)